METLLLPSCALPVSTRGRWVQRTTGRFPSLAEHMAGSCTALVGGGDGSWVGTATAKEKNIIWGEGEKVLGIKPSCS